MHISSGEIKIISNDGEKKHIQYMGPFYDPPSTSNLDK